MEKKNKILLIIFIMLITAIVVISVFKVYKRHIDNLYKVVEKKITESAKECFIDQVCTGEETTLGELIKNKYLTTQVNPVTKEDISTDLIITWDGVKATTSIR